MVPRGFSFERSYDRPYTKPKKIRSLPINGELLAILKAWKKACPTGEAGLVVPKSDGTMHVKERAPLA